MNSAQSDEDREMADEILPIDIVEPAVPVELTVFQPWHRPRKQFIRERQWMHYARLLIKKERSNSGLPLPPIGIPEVRYLTLPGIDYLDVRLLAELCREQECCLTSTGFLSGEESNPTLARARVREQSLVNAGYITGNSYTFPIRFEEIATEGGQALRDLRRKGPFHIVNVDACGSLARPSAQHANRMIDAIFRIVELQLSCKASRWLLFVTADVRHDSVARETLQRLCRAILTNAHQSSHFGDKVRLLFGAKQSDIESVINDASSGSVPDKYLKLFSLGFAKWLLHLASEKGWNIKTHSSYCYSTESGSGRGPTMTCLAFEFVPPPAGLHDRFEVTRASVAIVDGADEPAIRAVMKVSDMDNLDERMRSSGELRAEMALHTKELLAETGYHQSVLAELETDG